MTAELRTEHLYYEDTYLFECTAKVLHISEADADAGSQIVVTDRTVMHPQGGGQPSDVGTISSKDGSCVFEVSHVQKTARDSEYVQHVGKYRPDSVGSFGDDPVILLVNEERRRLNARLHSAGHLLDSAFEKIGWTQDQLVPNKGYHFPDGPYVEYTGNIPPEERGKVIEQLNDSSNALVKMDIPVSVAKDEKGGRIVNVGGTKCPCGGTHVKSTGEIGCIRATKITKKKKIIRVSYVVE